MSVNSILKQYSDERVALIERVRSKAVAVVVGRRRVLSGIRWNDELVITAAEAIGGAEHLDIRQEGDNELRAEVIATDLTTDVAVLRVEAAPTAVAPAAGPAGLLSTGQPIAVIGRERRGLATIWGNVQLAGPAWNSRRGGRIDQRLELDLVFDAAFEGGAVIDMEGQVAAMAVPGPCDRVLGIPAATIATIVAKVKQFGRLPRPYIGIRLQPLWLDDDARDQLGRKSRGIAAVGGVDAGSPAADAHIELGDLLLAVNGEPAESVNALARRIAAITPGDTITLELLRGGKPLTIEVRVGERPRG